MDHVPSPHLQCAILWRWEGTDMAFTTARLDIAVAQLPVDLVHGITFTASSNVYSYLIGTYDSIYTVTLYPPIASLNATSIRFLCKQSHTHIGSREPCRKGRSRIGIQNPFRLENCGPGQSRIHDSLSRVMDIIHYLGGLCVIICREPPRPSWDVWVPESTG